jgi:hypothetical protein
MAAISWSISRGVSGTKNTDFTIGVAAPGTGDMEFRYNTTDGQGKALTREDLVLALRAFERGILAGGANINIITNPPL